jgi:hypothetical protein
MKQEKKWVQVAIIILLGCVIIAAGNAISGSVLGNLLTIFGGIAIVYGIVDVFRKPKNRPPTTSS